MKHNFDKTQYNKSISIPYVEQSVSPKGSSATEGRKNMQITIRYYDRHYEHIFARRFGQRPG